MISLYQRLIVKIGDNVRISVFGLGYVGCVSMGCLAELGHEVIGVDVSAVKVDLINSGKPTIVEKEIDGLIAKHTSEGRITARMDPTTSAIESDVSIICVGTPSSADGSLNLEYIYQCAEQIGSAIKQKTSFHTIAIRSTVMPGTNKRVTDIIAASSGKVPDKDFGVVSNPEFLREGSAVKDYFNPPVTVLGSSCNSALHIMSDVYKDIKAELVQTEVGVAEIIKYVNNSYHALKVTFANEVGNVCRKLGIDSHKVMDVFCKDRQLNISDYYFKPGFAYGGSCLPKDLGALVNLSEANDLTVNVLSSIHHSNEYQKMIALELVKKYSKGKKIGIIGISFKQGTDDLRYSPMVDVLNQLIEQDYQVKIFDQNVSLSILIGANKEYIDKHIPYLSDMLVGSFLDLFEQSDTIVLNQMNPQIIALVDQNPEKAIIDFARIDDRTSMNNYYGLCW